MRLASSGLACILACVLAVLPTVRADRAVDLVAALGVASVAAVALALTTSIRLLPVPLLLLAVQFELHHVLQPVPVLALAVFAGALLLLGELVAWSLSLRTLALVDRGVVTARIRFLLAATAGASALATVMLGASTARLTGGLGDAAIGIAAVVLLLAAIATGARRLR